MKVGDRVRILRTGDTATVIEPPCTFRCIRVEVDPDPALITRGRRKTLPPRPGREAAGATAPEVRTVSLSEHVRANNRVEYGAGYSDGWDACLEADPFDRDGDPPKHLLDEQIGARRDGFTAGWNDAASYFEVAQEEISCSSL